MEVTKFFPSQDGDSGKRQALLNEFEKIMTYVDSLKSEGSPILGEKEVKKKDFYSSLIHSSSIPEKSSSLEEVTDELLKLSIGHPISNKNYFHNILPIPNHGSLVGNFLMNYLNGNNIWDVVGPAGAEAEVKVISMMRKLVGSQYENAWGYTTWGGQGAVFTSLRLALAKYDPYIKENGIPNNLYCFCSEVAHYSLLKSVEATGIGTKHLIRVKTNHDFTMNMDDLKKQMEIVIENGGIPLYVLATLGTTDSFAFDDIYAIKRICMELKNSHPISTPYIHADSAFGGFYRFFGSYDFKKNKLNFSKEVLDGLEFLSEKTVGLQVADSVCFDFHKLGQTSYTASLFLTKMESDLTLLDMDSYETPYVGDRGYGNYHTGYTLECSRQASSLSILASLLFLGEEGYQSLLGQYLTVNLSFRNELKKIPNIQILNDNHLGMVTNFRIYLDTKIHNWSLEINNQAKKEEVLKHNELNSQMFEVLGEEREKYFFGDTKRICCVRTEDSKEELPIYASKFICISPYTKPEEMYKVAQYLIEQINKVLLKKAPV